MDYVKLIIVGNLIQDAEIKQARDSDMKYADFTVATSSKGEMKVFYPVRAFGKLGEGCEMLKKGDRVLVEGILEISSYSNDSGEKQMTYRVVADTYRKL